MATGIESCSRMKRHLDTVNAGLHDEDILLEEPAPDSQEGLNVEAVEQAQLRVAKAGTLSKIARVSAPAPAYPMDNTERDDAEDSEPLFPLCTVHVRRAIKALERLATPLESQAPKGQKTLRFRGVTGRE